MINLLLASVSEIGVYEDTNILGNLWFIFMRILIFIYHIAPIVILLFIAVVVWRIYKIGKKDNDEKNLS